MPRTVITHARLVLADRIVADHTVVIDDGSIVRVCPADELPDEPGAGTVDAAGMYVAPGFIDLHIHGLGKCLVDRGPADLAGICELLPAYGVTGFLPTVCPRPTGEDARFLRELSADRPAGARVLGFHLEGPFLALAGSLPADATDEADARRARSLIEAAAPQRVVFSISPELEGAADVLAAMTGGGATVFITHTGATVEQTRAAVEAGARHATHFYDAFPCPAVRDPGVRPCGAVEAILADPRVSVDFILDGEHVDPVAVEVALLCKGPDGVCLVTDANVGAGLPPGTYEFAGTEIAFDRPGGPARMTAAGRIPGGLAGSGLTMDLAVRNAIDLLDVGLPMAVRMASANPARVLGLHRTKGQIAEGFDADLVLLDGDLRVRRTWIGGETVFEHTACLQKGPF